MTSLITAIIQVLHLLNIMTTRTQKPGYNELNKRKYHKRNIIFIQIPDVIMLSLIRVKILQTELSFTVLC